MAGVTGFKGCVMAGITGINIGFMSDMIEGNGFDKLRGWFF